MTTTTDSWQSFLASLDAHMENGAVQYYGQPDAKRLTVDQEDILVDLALQAMIRVEGADAESFLQGQFTNDIRQVTTGRAQLSAYCNPKGRMFAIFLISKIQDGYLLQLPAALAADTLKRLRMYVLRAKVKLDMAPDLVATGFSGPHAQSLISDVIGSAPSSPYESVESGGITVIRLPGPQPRFEMIAATEKQTSLWKALLLKNVTLSGASAWSWLNIQAGLPSILPGTVEEFVPQMANLDAIGGVSFTKGCYPGQEIVARMHYLGKLKQRMFKLHADIAVPPTPGTPVFAPNFPDQSIGAVVEAEVSPQGGCDMLAVLQISSVEDGKLHLASADGTRIIPQSLPYEFPAPVKR